MVKFNKKGQSVGLVTGLVFGVATLVIAVIIAFVITSTLSDANLLNAGRETITTNNEAGFINETTYTLDGASDARAVSGSYAITGAVNNTDNETILAANYTVSDSGIVSNLTVTIYQDVNFNYTYTQKTNEEFTTDSLTANLSEGVDNVSSKIPTVLLIAAIVLILGVMMLLIVTWQRMRVGGGGI